jgi:hypothetical protein
MQTRRKLPRVRFCRIPRASPGMMCVCRRGRLADKDLGQPASASSRPVQLVLDRRLLELIPIDSVTLSNEYADGERSPSRRYGADLLSPGPVIAARRHGCSAL